MTTVGPRELKNRLGENILVTERGRPVAELRPLSPAALDLDDRLRELAAKGVLRLPTRRPSPVIPKVRVPGPSLSQTLIEDREDPF